LGVRYVPEESVRNAAGRVRITEQLIGARFWRAGPRPVARTRRQSRDTPASQQERMLLTSRRLLRDKPQDMENELRGTLRNFGLRVGVVSAGDFEARVRELVMGHPPLAAIVAPLRAKTHGLANPALSLRVNMRPSCRPECPMLSGERDWTSILSRSRTPLRPAGSRHWFGRSRRFGWPI
jgi:hypothetical protein